MLTGLTILGDTGFEFTSTSSNDENSAVGLGGTSDHVLDEITMARSVCIDVNTSTRQLEGVKSYQ